MKKSFNHYFICWLLLMILFNVISFVIPSSFAGLEKYTDSFWIGYIFIMICLCIHIVFSYFFLSEQNGEKRILNVPINIISYIEIIIIFIAGTVCMVIPGIPAWLSVILCISVNFFSVTTLIVIRGVAENTSNANTLLNNKTSVYRELVESAQILCDLVNDGNEKRLATKIYEAIRYSDSISTSETSEIEQKIKDSLVKIKECSRSNNEIEFKNETKKILQLIEERKVICMSAKHR